MEINKNLNNIFKKINFKSEETKVNNANFSKKNNKSNNIKKFFKFLLKNKKIFLGLMFLIFLLLISIFIPFIYPYDYFTELGVSNFSCADKSFSFLAPFKFAISEQQKIKLGEFVWPHIFGTDRNGRDYFIRVICGTRISLLVGVISAFIVLIIGILYGSIAGMKGGKTDLIMMRIADALYSLPDLIAVIFFSVIIKEFLCINNDTIISSLFPMLCIFILFYWIETSLLIRSQVLLIKKRDFIIASKTMGATNSFIIKKHIIPNCSSIIIVAITKRIPSAIFAEATLSFLGFGISEPTPSLGCLITSELGEILNYPWLTIIPAIIVSLIVLSFYFIGEGLKTYFNSAIN